MIAILQRVTSASVEVDEKTVGRIQTGFLVLLGVESNDDSSDADILAAKISGLRVFTDENGKMNLSLSDVSGAALVISNFTLCADCSHGRRPSFFSAARPEKAEPLYVRFCEKLHEFGVSRVEMGVFGADMKVSLVNDGPVTIEIKSGDLKNDRH